MHILNGYMHKHKHKGPQQLLHVSPGARCLNNMSPRHHSSTTTSDGATILETN